MMIILILLILIVTLTVAAIIKAWHSAGHARARRCSFQAPARRARRPVSTLGAKYNDHDHSNSNSSSNSDSATTNNDTTTTTNNNNNNNNNNLHTKVEQGNYRIEAHPEPFI